MFREIFFEVYLEKVLTAFVKVGFSITWFENFSYKYQKDISDE